VSYSARRGVSKEKRTPTDSWVKAGVLISLVLGLASLGWQGYTYLREETLNKPRFEVSYVSDLVLQQPSEGYIVRWINVKFEVIVFVVSAHEFRLSVESTSFNLSDSARQHLLPEYVDQASVEISKYDVHGTSSGSITLLVPIDAQFWLRPESTVHQNSIELGILTFRISILDLRTNESLTQINTAQVIWRTT